MGMSGGMMDLSGVVGVRLSPGSVRKHGAGFQARFECAYLDADGGVVARTHPTRGFGAKTLAAARRMLPDVRQGLKADLERRILADRIYPGDSDLLAEYLGRYVAEREEAHAIEPTTAANYRSTIRQIMRHLPDDTRLGDVDAATVRRMDSALLGDGMAEDTVGKCHRFLKQVLDAAEDEGVIARNPITRSVRPPRRERREPDALDEETERRLKGIVSEMALTPLTVAIRMALETGMRNEEVIGLRWRDVERRGTDGDAVRGIIHVRHAVTTAGGRVVAKCPKSAAGRRDIPITAALMGTLDSWASAAFGTTADDPGVRDLYVLGTGDGRPYHPTRLQRGFSELAAMYGITCASGRRATFYALRHTAITRMLRAGVDAKTVSSIAGHSKVAETLDVYASTDPDAKARAVAMAASAGRREG